MGISRRKFRNRVARNEVKAIIARADFLRELLKEFGLTLSAFDPGVSAFYGHRLNEYTGKTHADHVSFDSNQWGVVEPLLMELRDKRKTKP